jgi:hypothetical protein
MKVGATCLRLFAVRSLNSADTRQSCSEPFHSWDASEAQEQSQSRMN